MKTCARCGEARTADEFRREPRASDGLHSWCKPCVRVYDREGKRRRYERKRPIVAAGFKHCMRCQEILPVDAFGPNRAREDGLQEYCRPCKRSYANALYARTRAQTLHRYGLTLEDFDRMFAEQDGRCAACDGRSEKRLHIDHDHSTGRIRGLLCENCNLGIGKFKDDPERLESAARYLREVR